MKGTALADRAASTRGENFAKALRARLKCNPDFNGRNEGPGKGVVVVHHAASDETPAAAEARNKAGRRLFRLELRRIPLILFGKALTQPLAVLANLPLVVVFVACFFPRVPEAMLPDYLPFPAQYAPLVFQAPILVIGMAQAVIAYLRSKNPSGGGSLRNLNAEGGNILVVFTGRGTKCGKWSKRDDVVFYVRLYVPDDSTIIIDDFTANHVSRGCTTIAKNLLPLMIVPDTGGSEVEVGFHCKTNKLVEYYTRVFKAAFEKDIKLANASTGYYRLKTPGRLF